LFSGLLYDSSLQHEPCQAMICLPFLFFSHEEHHVDKKLDSQNNIHYSMKNYLNFL